MADQIKKDIFSDDLYEVLSKNLNTPLQFVNQDALVNA